MDGDHWTRCQLTARVSQFPTQGVLRQGETSPLAIITNPLYSSALPGIKSLTIHPHSLDAKPNQLRRQVP